MKPIEFPEMNCTFAKNQPQYLPLPALREQDGHVTSCWRAALAERLYFLFTGKMWLTQMTFGSPLQPLRPAILKPVIKKQ